MQSLLLIYQAAYFPIQPLLRWVHQNIFLLHFNRLAAHIVVFCNVAVQLMAPRGEEAGSL